ncbi:unnamed protein product [Ilex paraguariensis]|uniref:rhamnogalacturonan endolyase n=1 Tax=Ilex paraguariensis TaxID=185542 RepID=A0ABC8SFQ0_9AQUA
MEKLGCKKQWHLVFWCLVLVLPLFLIAECSVTERTRWNPASTSEQLRSFPPVKLHGRHDTHVVLDNGLVKLTLGNPGGMLTSIEYNGMDNILEHRNKETDRGYWDVIWSEPGEHGHGNILSGLHGTSFQVIGEDDNQIEVSFSRRWNPSDNNSTVPLNSDKRYILKRGCPGFYTYTILERLEGWRDINLPAVRLAFKLQGSRFHYMALSDDRQRTMASPEDRRAGKVLGYKEAVLLPDSVNPAIKGVDDKYQYSCDNKDNRVHGWISSDPQVGFWVITPSYEYRSAGPVKQELTSHTGPTSLAVFISGHYSGKDLNVFFRDGEPWKKVFGPVFVYLNSGSGGDNHQTLWQDAKEQMLVETQSWPYNFPLSKDFPHAHQRGTVSGRLMVRDRYISRELIPARSAYVGLAPPGELGSWQKDTKGYQFWNQTDDEGNFLIRGVRAGNYNLYAWVDGVIGDYKYETDIQITPGSEIRLADLVYHPPRNGPTLWEIGIPDRSAAEFFVPDPDPKLKTRLSRSNSDKFRQYGLWARYTDLYPDQDLVYTIGSSNYKKDWFFAHVNRRANDIYEPTTWQIIFHLGNIEYTGTYTLRIALASANGAHVKVWMNRDPNTTRRLFSTSLVGRDNAIARHGIHGLYWLYSVDIPASYLQSGRNTMFLQQSSPSSPFSGVMYDYLRLEGPPRSS